MTLKDYEKAYDTIMDSNIKVDKKNRELAKLMTQMEEEFNIPMLNDEAWNSAHKEVIELYRIISNSREF